MNQPDVMILANTIDPEESRVAIVENGRLAELFIERMWECQKSGEIYKARVESVIPGMNAAFVGLGDGRNGFLYLNDARGVKVCQNCEILVQVVKTARKNKGARVTTRISLPGRYLVLVPGGHDVGVSKRIVREEERVRLKEAVRSLDLKGFGVILRTASEGIDVDALADDLQRLKSLWADIENTAAHQKAPCLLYKDTGLVGRVLRDELNSEVSQIVVDNQEEYDRIKAYLQQYGSAENPPDLSFHRGNIPLFEYYDVEKEIDALLDNKVWLKSGAYLVIDQAEALTVVDVNTGKYTGGANLRETVLSTNLEAAEEIAWQLRLRSIGGIVVVDFIDMEPEEDRKTLLAKLDEVFARDRCRVKVYGLSPLGLVEMTRKRARADLRSVLTRPCPCCGSGFRVFKEDTLAMMLKRFIRKVFMSGRAEALLVDANETVAAYVGEVYLSAWEESFGRRIFVRASRSMPLEKFRLELQGSLSSVEARLELMRNRGDTSVVYRTTDP
ncbi:MAG: Rne/Rng family ribonuclease [Pyramidobacter sp.]